LGQFNQKKIICNPQGGIEGLHPYNDYEGKYGMNKQCFGIPISSKKEGEYIIKILNSQKFKKFLKSMIIGGFYFIDYRIFNYLKKDFWKYFVDGNGNEI
jgi:hypothetical protein